MSKQRASLLLFAAATLIPAAAQAQSTFTQTATDSGYNATTKVDNEGFDGGSNSTVTGEPSGAVTSSNWNNGGLAPAANNFYVDPSFILRTPTVTASETFAGASLTIGNGVSTAAALDYKSVGSFTLTIQNLSLNLGTINQANGSTATFAGNGITLLSGGGIINTALENRFFVFSEGFTGSGALTLEDGSATGAAAGNPLTIYGGITLNNSSSYTGGTIISQYTKVTAAAAEAFGTGAVALGSYTDLVLSNNAAFFSGSSLIITDTGTTADLVSLGYTGTDTIAGLTYNGTMLAAGTYTAAALNTATGSSDFSGTGNITIPAQAASAPEPGSLAVALLGLPVALAFRRRKK